VADAQRPNGQAGGTVRGRGRRGRDRARPRKITESDANRRTRQEGQEGEKAKRGRSQGGGEKPVEQTRSYSSFNYRKQVSWPELRKGFIWPNRKKLARTPRWVAFLVFMVSYRTGGLGLANKLRAVGVSADGRHE